MRFEFIQTHREFSLAWIGEYYRMGKWGGLRLLGGPAMVYVGWQLRVLRPGHWLAAVGSFAIGYGIYYAVKPLLQVLLLLRRRHKLGGHRTTMVVDVDAEGIVIHSGSAHTTLGWDQIARAGWRSSYLWFELAQSTRAIIPLRSIEDREAIEQLFREQGKWVG